MRGLGGLLLAVLMAGTAPAYDTTRDSSDIYVVTWNPGPVPMQIKLPAPSGTLIDGGTSYETSVRAAMQMWNAVTGLVNLQGNSQVPGSYANGNGINEIVMDSTVDGDAFSANTLAVTTSYRQGNERTEADIVFNTAYTWDSYRGATRSDRQDIRRVALHELGHVLGLQHPDEAKPVQSVSAIMNSRISSVETLQADDIAGMQSLYGAPGFVPLNNDFANASSLSISGGSAQVTGTNIGATAESVEPRHDGETPTHSVWWRWTAPNAAPATVTTYGSNFDTVVAIYTGTSLGSLAPVVSNDDEERGIVRTSKLSFTPTAGMTYYLAVDGWGGYFGQITMNLTTGEATGTAPAITNQPANQSVAVGGSVVFSVAASGAPTGYQWLLNGKPLNGATSNVFTLNPVTSASAGNYSVVVINAAGSVTSTAASLTVLPGGLSNQVVTAGHDVTLAAPTMNGSYQWQVSTNNGSSWSNVGSGPGYTGVATATLTINAVAAALNGNLYRYVVTTAGGTATSPAITLAVSAALLPFPVAIAVDAFGNLYVGDNSTHALHKITTANQVSLFAGSSGQTGSADGAGSVARFNQPSGLSATAAGVLTVADTANGLIRRVTTSGVVTTLAGTAGVRGNADGAGTTATFGMPIGISQNSGGTFTIADATNHTIRQLSPANAVSTFAGSAGVAGSADAAGTSARFNYPTGIAVDASGTIYVADTTNNLIRKITVSGTVTTLAGVVAVSGWQDGTGGGALFNQPGGLATDSAGNLYVADTGNSVIRKVTPNGVVTTLAGLSTIGGLKDGTGSDAWFNQPRAVAVDAGGNVYVADTGNAAIRKITPAGQVTTLALTAGPANPGGGSSTGGGGGGTTTPPTSSGGGGGGGGAPSAWFLGAMCLILGWRWRRHRPA